MIPLNGWKLSNKSIMLWLKMTCDQLVDAPKDQNMLVVNGSSNLNLK
jgi:hypothetical protein